jgi:transporter family protein
VTPFAWAAMAALCWGFAPVFEKIGLQGEVDPSVGVFVRSIGVMIGALFFLPFWGKIGSQLSTLSARNWAFIFMGGIMASIVGQLFFYRALKVGEISRVVPVGASYPVVGFFIGLLFFKEPVTLHKTLGVFLVVAGAWMLK